MINRTIEFVSRGEARWADIGSAPDPGPDEILLRTLYSGITNGTEGHALRGERGWTHYPGRHGYQHVAVVEAAGDRVEGFQPGDRVFHGQYVGHRGWNIQKIGPADRSRNDSHLTLRLPPEVDAQECALFGVAGVAMRAIRRCRVGLGGKVWVVGGGLIGQFAAQCARAAGAEATLTEMSDRRLSKAAELGAHRALNAASEEDRRALRDGGPYSCIFDACGSASLFSDIIRDGSLARGGAIASIAVRTEVACPWSLLHMLEASIEVSCHFSLSDLEAVLGLLQRGILKIDPLISRREPIARALDVYATLRDSPDDLLGVVFDWNEET